MLMFVSMFHYRRRAGRVCSGVFDDTMPGESLSEALSNLAGNASYLAVNLRGGKADDGSLAAVTQSMA